MSRPTRRQLLGIVAALALAAAVIVAVSLGSDSSSDTATGKPDDARNAAQLTVVPAGTDVITLGPSALSRPVSGGFIGLSLEYNAVLGYAGRSPSAVNPVLVQLIRQLAPGQPPVLRIGGNSADSTWWPVRGMSTPGGVTFTLTRRWLAVMRALSRSTGAHVIPGINLEADSLPLASAEARALVSGIGPGAVQTLELGNEPELWGSFTYYRAADGSRVNGRPASYHLPAFTQDFTRFARVMPPLPLAGPTTGVLTWAPHLKHFIAAEPRLGLVTLHRYPLERCFTSPGDPMYPTIKHLLAASSSGGLANSVKQYVLAAHAAGRRLRIDELNSVACGGKRGVSDTFASALWVIDTLFQMARVGVDGVNIHTFPGASYGLFDFRHVGGVWSAFVAPEYYGLLLFAQAAPPGSVLLHTSPPTVTKVAVWATRATNGQIRVVLINKATAHSRYMAIRAPAGYSSATLMRLRSTGVRAKQNVTLGGQTFGSETTTGVLPPERAVTLTPVAGDYVFKLPPASAAMLTLTP